LLIRQDSSFDEFQVRDFKGITQLADHIVTLKELENYETVRSIAIVRDAETNAGSAAQSVISALSKAALPTPKCPGEIVSSGGLKTGFVLFPSCGAELENGTLEDLCLQSLAGDDAKNKLSAADNLLQKYTFKRPHKNRLHTYLSMTDAYVSLKIGEAFRAGAFSFSLPQIESLKEFLLRFLE
jgi:hypothetical protein